MPPPAPLPQEPSLADRFSRWASQEGTGTRLLAWAGGAVTLLGIVLLLVMAIQQGWVGPVFRVIGGAVLEVCLLGCAEWVYRRSPEAARAGAFSLVSTGIATLYLDVLASTALYHFLSVPVGLFTALVLAGGGLWWANRWSSQVLAVGVVLACALCAPLLFASAVTSGAPVSRTSGTALLTAFLVILKIAATPVQLRRAWPALTAAATLPAVLSALVTDGQVTLDASDKWTAAAAAGVVAVSGITLSIVTARRRPKDPIAIALLLTAGAPVLFLAPPLGRWPGFGITLALAAAYFAVWRTTKYVPPRLRVAAGAACALAVFQASVSTVEGSARSMALLGEAAVLAWLAARIRGKRMLLTATIYGGAGAILALAFDVPPTLFLHPDFAEVTAGTGTMVTDGFVFLCLGVVSTLCRGLRTGSSCSTVWACHRYCRARSRRSAFSTPGPGWCSQRACWSNRPGRDSGSARP